MKIAIIGATGLVGRTMLNILHEHGFTKNNEIILYASNKSSGSLISIENQTFIVRELSKQNIDKDISFALFSAGSNVSLCFAKEFAKNGSYVIDNSSAFRRKKNIPLIVPEINMDSLCIKNKIIANPNCSTILLSLPLHALHQKYSVKRVIVSTYQAVSGAGKTAIDDLENNTTNKLSYPIQNNLIPQIDKFCDDNYTCEEYKLRFEICKIFSNKNIKVTATAVRVPVKNCHAESINIEFKKKPNINKIKEILSNTPGVKFLDDRLPMPIVASEKDDIYVGRIRLDKTHKNCINMFLCGDNIRKGAALNAVQIMEEIIQKFYMK